MADEGEEIRGISGYAVTELLRALARSSELAHRRAAEWRRLLAGILDGTLKIGSRTPVKDTPAWVTLDVLRGGFATGGFAAGGDLLPHERDKLARVSRAAGATERATLNGYYLSDAGRAELTRLLESGCYRVAVPEETALLVNSWLLERGEADAAEALLRELTPFFDKLRFYPAEHARPLRAARGVSIETAGETKARLEARKPQTDVLRMIESIRIWAPLYDRAVALFLETVEGEPPRLNAGTVEGGVPCRHFPPDFRARATAILEDYRRLRAQHRLCKKPDKPKENFVRLRRLLGIAAEDPAALGERDVAELRWVLASFVTAHGAPGSASHTALRSAQAVEAERPLHHRVAATLARRLAAFPADEGVAEFEPVAGALSATEAAEAGTREGAPVPPELVARARRCFEAPLGELVALDLVPSSEVMARLLPPITAAARTSAIQDLGLRRLFASTYTAFRRRRSLLLLNLESQAKLGELPWIRAIEPWIGGDESSRAASRAVLDDAATLAIKTFPHTIVPNKLVKELRALAVAAGTPLPLVEELAADIFMGDFSELFLQAAKLAAAGLQGTL
jgi:hypothetical protein